MCPPSLFAFHQDLNSSPPSLDKALARPLAGDSPKDIHLGSQNGVPVEPMALFIALLTLENKRSYGKWPFIVDFPIKHGDFP